MAPPAPPAPPADPARPVIRTEAELAAWILDTFGIRIPNRPCCAHHTTPWRAFADAFFSVSSMAIWNATRGSGKSFLLSLLGVCEVVAQNAGITILGGSEKQSQRVHDHMAALWQRPRAPRELLAGEPTADETHLIAGGWIVALAASARSVRGPHPQKLRIDEADEMSLDLFDAAMGQTLSLAGDPPAQTVISSTYHRARGTMRELLARAALRGWRVYDWCKEEVAEPHGWLPRAEIDRKKTEVTDRMWRVEYEGQKPSLENAELSPAVITRTFSRRTGQTYAGALEEYLEFEPPFLIPVAGPDSVEARWDPVWNRRRRDVCWLRSAQYAHGADWARTTDRTVLVVLRVDVRPWRLVAYWTFHRLDWPIMVGRFDDLLERYPGEGSSDATGIGDVVHGYIKRPDLIEAVKLVGQTRSDVFTDHIRATQDGEWESPYVDSLVQDHEVTTGDLFSSAGHPPDGFVASALATRAAKRIRPRGDLGITGGA
jgi:hypothetical protein